MGLSDYDFQLPEELIAQRPAEPRDHARLLVYDRIDRSITDDIFYNLSSYLVPETTLVLNNSKVEKVRLLFGEREVFVTDIHNDHTIDALVRPGKTFKAGARVELVEGVSADVMSVLPDGRRRLKLNVELGSPLLKKHRHTPFPPYINADETLSDRYQTVYAVPSGSKAAPTAGLHFTAELLKELQSSFPIVEITLHVGLGTFAPLRNEQIKSGRLHEEHFIIGKAESERLNQSSHLTAVGTTTLRALESAVKTGSRTFSAVDGTTDIFIQPGYRFKAVDSLVTNFHLPKSSLLILVAALVGIDEVSRIYQHAIEEKYRFYSFGDAMLIL